MEQDPKLTQKAAEEPEDTQVLKLQAAKRDALAKQKPEPDAWRSPLSFLVFWWYLRRVLCLGWRKTLVMDDLPKLNKGLFTDVTHGAFVRSWTKRMTALKKRGARGERALQRCKEGKNWSLLLGVLVTSYFWYIVGSVLLHLVSTGAGFAFPLLLDAITRYLELCGAEADAARNTAYVFAALNFVCPLASGLFHVHSNRLATLAQVKTSAAIIAELFRKSMRMSNASQQSIERGKIINFMSADVNNIIQFLNPAMADIVVAPITIIVAVGLLWRVIGVSVFVGLGVLVVATPVSFIFINKLTNLQGDMLAHTDRRIALVNQLLAGMKSLKMYAWEAAQEARIHNQRKKEMRKLGRMVPYYTLMECTMVASPILAAIASFLTFAAIADPSQFTPGAIFSAVALFGILRPPVEELPHAMVEAGAAIVSLKRLTMFLTLEDRQDEDATPFLGGNGMAVENGEFIYPKATGPKFEFSDDESEEGHDGEDDDDGSDSDDEKEGAADGKNGKKEAAHEPKVDKEPEEDAHEAVVNLPGSSDDGSEGGSNDSFTLRNIDFSVKAGELLCVTGRVGSGKSSLVSAVLGDMERTAGTVRITGSIAYVAQSAWITNDTVQGNITFGKPFDQGRYNRVVEATCLEHDFKILPAGDSTEIGEKGVNLSGGQKQRISMARAAYAGADLYIMDDPLSAVDVHVGKHIFANCITGLLKDKAVLLVTNQLQYAPEADSILYLEDGEMAAYGNYDEVVQNEGFAALLHEYEATAGEEEDDEEEGCEDEDINVEKEKAYLMHATSGSGMHAIEAARMQAVVNQSQLRSQNSLASRSFTTTDPLSLTATRSVKLLPSIRSTDDVDTEPEDKQLLGSRPSRKGGLSGRSSTPAGGLVLRESMLGSKHSMGPLKSRATWAPGCVQQGQGLEHKPNLQPDSFSSLVPRKSAKAAANLYIPRSAGADGASKWDNDKAGTAPVSTPASGAEIGTASPFEGMKIAGDPQKPGKAPEEAPAGEKAGATMTADEEQDEGSVSFRVYWAYFRAGSGVLAVAILAMLAAAEAMSQYQQVWLSRWTGSEAHSCDAPAETHGPPALNTQYFPGYVACGLAYVVGLTLATAGLYTIGWLASTKLHNQLIQTVARAPMYFFDTTPAGRILNRFSKDTYDMDHELPNQIFALVSHLLELAGLIIIVSVLQPFFLAGAVPMLLVYMCVHRFYTRSYIELQRIDAVSRSPVYSHFAESLAGMDTIRAYGYQSRFALMSDSRVDYNHRGFYALNTGDQWLTMTLDFIGALLSFLVSMLVVALKGQLGPSRSALILERTGEMAVKLQVIVMAAATMERRFNAIERILEYHKLPQEKPQEIKDRSPPPAWPTQGVIRYQDVWMRYREGLDPVLKGVTFEVKSGESVGIVGRTGSGKSSLIVALFRLAEPYQGVIMLDGHNLLELGLQDVRGRIAAIPQEPILFSGSIRSNVDPYSAHSDAEIWLALERVNLKENISNMNGLTSRVTEGGVNWSVGQRQLLCVARALLRKPKVLVLDEATASVDGETDAFIQRAIRQNFSGSTIMTIAHRLNTIMDSSKVLVMHDGTTLEYDTVPNLLRMQQGAFRAMVEGAGISHEALNH